MVVYVFWIDFQNVSALLLFIAIKRQWCLECILKLEGFAKTIDFMLRRDLLIGTHCGINCLKNVIQTFKLNQVESRFNKNSQLVRGLLQRSSIVSRI